MIDSTRNTYVLCISDSTHILTKQVVVPNLTERKKEEEERGRKERRKKEQKKERMEEKKYPDAIYALLILTPSQYWRIMFKRIMYFSPS